MIPWQSTKSPKELQGKKTVSKIQVEKFGACRQRIPFKTKAFCNSAVKSNGKYVDRPPPAPEGEQRPPTITEVCITCSKHHKNGAKSLSVVWWGCPKGTRCFPDIQEEMAPALRSLESKGGQRQRGRKRLETHLSRRREALQRSSGWCTELNRPTLRHSKQLAD